MNGGKSHHTGDFADCVDTLFNEQLAFVKLQIADILFRRNSEVIFKERLQAGA